MATIKISAGSRLPAISLPLVGGGQVTMGQSKKKGNWQLVFVYRGRHCPICKQYLMKLETLKDKSLNTEAEIVALAGDPEAKAVAMVEAGVLTVPVAYELSTKPMKDLGLYISHPRSPEETDKPFPEHGMFAVNADGHVKLIAISNMPFNRSDLEELLETVEWIQKNDYPNQRNVCSV